jgi:hypothetical protein
MTRTSCIYDNNHINDKASLLSCMGIFISEKNPGVEACRAIIL